jgi:hypothetical protein
MRIRDQGSCKPCIRDLGWKKLDKESGINIPDPQHCLEATVPCKKWILTVLGYLAYN